MTFREELSIKGFSIVENVFEKKFLYKVRDILLKIKEDDINLNGVEYLLKIKDYEHIRDLTSKHKLFIQIIENNLLNKYVDIALNNKAVIHSYNAIITDPNKNSDSLGFRFHRDMPWFPRTRTSINVFIPLIDFNKSSGATEIVPGTHLFEKMPSNEYLEDNCKPLEISMNSICIMDSTLYHRAGKNISKNSRPLITIKYTLAPFKQQIDFCKTKEYSFKDLSEIAKQRLGWNVRVCESEEEFREDPKIKKWKSGQYDMTNTNIDL